MIQLNPQGQFLIIDPVPLRLLKGEILAPFNVLKSVIRVLSRSMSDVITWKLAGARALPTIGM